MSGKKSQAFKQVSKIKVSKVAPLGVVAGDESLQMEYQSPRNIVLEVCGGSGKHLEQQKMVHVEEPAAVPKEEMLSPEPVQDEE